MEAFDATFVKYNNAGFVIKELHVDPEFECLQQEMELNDITVNLTAAEEHQSDIERMFRVIKERFRAIYHRCPFAMWPKIMIIRGASEAVKWLNTFPPAGGISTTYSPRAIITGRPVDYDKHCHIRFGSYVQAITQNDPTNTPKERTMDAIFLRTLDNIQGGYEVLNLKDRQAYHKAPHYGATHTTRSDQAMWNNLQQRKALSLMQNQSSESMLCLQEWMTTIQQQPLKN